MANIGWMIACLFVGKMFVDRIRAAIPQRKLKTTNAGYYLPVIFNRNMSRDGEHEHG